MNVPPYVPPPIEIPGNVAAEPYRVRLGFVRRVSLLHGASVAVVAAVAALDPPRPGPFVVWGLVLGLLALLSLVRWLAKGRDMEQRLSMAVFPFLLAALGAAVAEALRAGFPIWSGGLGVLACLVYSLLCGRDLSYVGMYVIGAGASSVGVAIVAWRLGVSAGDAWIALGFNAAFSFYHVYDLASLLSRRRLGEEFGAVADLYRDALNFFTYTVRVALHWRRHRIWSK